MSCFIEYKGKTAFHPGYFLNEIIDESGLSKEDFALRLGITPKNLSILLQGEQSLYHDIADKIARMFGGSIEYWLNLQKTFDEKKAEILSEKEKKYDGMTRYEILQVYGMSCSLVDIVHLKEKYRKQL